MPVSGPLPDELDVLARDLVREHLGRVADAVHRLCRTGRRVLDGEIATAVATAYLHLSWRRSDHAALVADARAVLDAATLAPLVVVETADVDGRPWMFTGRRTCCPRLPHRAQPRAAGSVLRDLPGPAAGGGPPVVRAGRPLVPRTPPVGTYALSGSPQRSRGRTTATRSGVMVDV